MFLNLYIIGLKIMQAHVAQLAEHPLGKGEVSGSSPLAGSRLFDRFMQR